MAAWGHRFCLRWVNLVFCAPTSGGKSLAAGSSRQGADASRTTGTGPVRPSLHSLVNEKSKTSRDTRAHVQKADAGRWRSPVAVRAFAGETGSAPLARPSAVGRNEIVAVTTIEKASVTISRLAEEGRLGELCAVVVDELHLVGEEGRGGVRVDGERPGSPTDAARSARRAAHRSLR